MTSVLFRSPESRDVVLEAYARLLQATPQAESRQVATRFGATHVLVAGNEQAPPLVVLHGATANSALAIREAHPLLPHFRLYVPDVIGQSVKSADVKLDTTTSDYALWLEDVLDALALPRAHVYGASYGAFVARKLAEHQPERIDRLVLLVPAGIVAAPVLRAATRTGIPLLLFRTLGSQAALQRLLAQLMTTPDGELESYLQQAFRHYRLEIAAPPLGTPEPLRAFRRPTLILGASDDITCPAADLQRRAPELFPHAAVEVLADSRHIPGTDERSRRELCARVTHFLLAPT